MPKFMGMLACGLAMLAAAPALATDADKLLADNYPRESLRLGEEGSVGLKLGIDGSGKLLSCTVSKSSGYARLDRASCDVMLIHVIKLVPPKATEGRHAHAVKDAQIDWQLPPGTPRPPVAPPRSPDAELAAAAETITCTTAQRMGSVGLKQKVCLSAADRERAQEYARRNRDAL